MDPPEKASPLKDPVPGPPAEKQKRNMNIQEEKPHGSVNRRTQR